MQSDPDDFDTDDEFDAPLAPPLQPPLAPQQKLPSLRGMGASNIDDEFNEEDFDDDFDDDFEDELEDDYPFELELGSEQVAHVAEVADLDVAIAAGDLDEDDEEPAALPDDDAEEVGDAD